MSFPFFLICDLLEQAHRHSTGPNRRGPNADIVAKWFAKNRTEIDTAKTRDASALLSTLLPEKRTDRVYGIQAATLQNIIGRSLGLGATRVGRLTEYKRAGSGKDLADCVESLVAETLSVSHQVSVEEIDALLHGLAANCRFSSPNVRSSQSPLSGRNRVDLESIYRRLDAREAKWFTRLVLKDYQPVVLDPGLVYRCLDPLLPLILRVHDNFAVSLSQLQALRTQPGRIQAGDLVRLIKPRLGVKVARQTWLKGRSIKNCMDLGDRRMSCEKKIDGEYCQIHIDLSKGTGRRCVQIFSKSGKDSTTDRAGLHSAILESLDIGKSSCRIAKGCILEGELVVFSDREQRVMPFHKIRKYVSRSGRFLRIDQDSQQHDYEHLMIIYFDALLIDDESLLGARQSQRFKRLSNLISCRPGHAKLVERLVIDFDHELAASHLRNAFARCIIAGEEGLVLKPDEPYFDFGPDKRRFSGCVIKMKKEYIANFGDVGDFAVVAARYDPDRAKCYRIPNLKWTHFYLGCLNNKDAVQRFNAKPEFTVVNVVDNLNETQLKTLLTYSNPKPVPSHENDSLVLNMASGVVGDYKSLVVVFTKPLVFDMRCFSFDMQGNTGHWSLRFPVVSKIHFDRSYLDTMSFAELQRMAEEAKTAPVMEDSQEMLDWIAKLEGADPKGVPVDAASQLTVSSWATPSPRGTASTQPSLSPTLYHRPSRAADANRDPNLAEVPAPAPVPVNTVGRLAVSPLAAPPSSLLSLSKRKAASTQPTPSPSVHHFHSPHTTFLPSTRVEGSAHSLTLPTPLATDNEPLAGETIKLPSGGPSSSCKPFKRPSEVSSSPKQRKQRKGSHPQSLSPRLSSQTRSGKPSLSASQAKARRLSSQGHRRQLPQTSSQDHQRQPSLASSQELPAPTPSPSHRKQPPSTPKRREPLTAISVNSSQSQPRTTPSSSFHLPYRKANMSTPSSSEDQTTCVSFSTEPAQNIPSSQTEPDSSAPQGALVAQLAETAQHACRAAGAQCRFRKSVFLLSPTVAANALVTEQLFQAHGIQDFITDPQQWVTELPPGVIPNDPRASILDPRPWRPKKVCLVDVEALQEGRDLAIKVTGTPLFWPNGLKEYVEFYDWRYLLLEAQVEAGDRSGLGGWSSARNKTALGLY